MFIDIFSVVGHSFERCLSHFYKVLKRCDDCNLVLGSSHFREGYRG